MVLKLAQAARPVVANAVGRRKRVHVCADATWEQQGLTQVTDAGIDSQLQAEGLRVELAFGNTQGCV